MPSKLFEEWLEAVVPTVADVPLFNERSGARALGLAVLKKRLADHFVGEETVLKMGGSASATRPAVRFQDRRRRARGSREVRAP